MAGLKIRSYQCDVRKSDQAALNCAGAGDGSLAISTQGGVRLLRVASGYPVTLSTRLGQQRFWAETGGNVLRGVRDLERTRYDQRLNGIAWDTLRTALAIPAHNEPVAPLSSGPFLQLRSVSFSNVDNYSLRTFTGDSSVLDSNGDFTADEQRKTVSGGVDQPFVRNRSYWTGTEWYDCPNDGAKAIVVASQAPHRPIYCKGYVDERVGNLVLTLSGRLMNEVVNDIRAYGSTDSGTAYSTWGPAPSDAAYTDRVEIRVAFDANRNKARFTQNNRLVSSGFSTNYSTVHDTTHTVETVGGVKLMKFAAMPADFASRFRFQRMFAERNGGVWCACKDSVAAEPIWTIRLNGSATSALRTALGLP